MKRYTQARPEKGTKSVFWAYVFWLFGGMFGLHHFYLGRDRQAFIWATTWGGYFGLGWLGDGFKIRKYVEDANDDPKFIEFFILKLKQNKKPPFSTNRFIGQIMVAYFWAQLLMMAVPDDEIIGINWKFFNWLTPLASALGVWTVGNMGRQKGKIWWALAGAYGAYPLRWYFFDETVWLSALVVCSALAFDSFGKEWRRTPREKKGFFKRVQVLTLCIIIYAGLWSSYFYFNCKVIDSEGDEIPLHEAIHHFFTSPWWTDIKASLYETYNYAQHHGWDEIWRQIIDLSDPHGEMNAYKVLGLSQDSSQNQITSTWRRLSKEWHPDKVKDPALKREAQEKFMEIQQAYEILSNVKNKRKRRNKKSNTD